MICRDNDNERWSFVGHLFLWIVAVILFLGDVGDSPRQWRRECGLEGAEKGEWCAIGYKEPIFEK